MDILSWTLRRDREVWKRAKQQQEDRDLRRREVEALEKLAENVKEK